MSTVNLIIVFDGRQKTLYVNSNDSMRTVLNKVFDLFKIKNQNSRKYIFKFGNEVINANDSALNKTVGENNFEDDDQFELVDEGAIDAGKNKY